jgi:dethiobiotin synthetase
MSPVSERLTVLDLAERLKFPLLLVVANRLGCVGHTLLASEAIKARNLRLAGIVLNTLTHECQSANSKISSAGKTLEETNLKLIEQFLPGEFIHNCSANFAPDYAAWSRWEG